MSASLPAHASLRQLRNQAKDLHRAAQVREPEAFRRFREHHPRHRTTPDDRLAEAGLTLQDAQLVIAREYGFDSWPKLAASLSETGSAEPWPEQMVGSSAVAQRLRALIERAAATDVPVLVAGEKGVGKRLAARLIHAQSRRRHGLLVQVSCEGEDLLLEGEVFGYEQGAFTGAAAAREGRLQAASDGTLLLDEIGALSASAQTRLQGFLEHGTYRRLGGAEDLSSGARLLATASVDLQQRVAAGLFREDLCYQIQVLRLDVPPLRERAGDIPELAGHFAARAAGAGAGGASGFCDEALALLASHAWPGNVRELRAVVEGIVAGSAGETISAEAVRGRLGGGSGARASE
ncbi:MAG: sigma 54-interacting transcriptional regulator [Candidatus Latescibacterota bacterium]